MASPSSQPDAAAFAAVGAFAAAHYAESGAERFGIDVTGLTAMLADIFTQRGLAENVEAGLQTLHLEELVLSRACVAGNERAWEIFLGRYRELMYTAAYKIAREETTGRALADSLYAELYGLNERAGGRTSKLQFYLGRGSLAGWLRTVLAQEYINQYRRTRRETSLDAVLETGKQFAAQEVSAHSTDSHLEAATAAELAALDTEERFLLVSYYIDRRTLAEIARVMDVHESTISRKLERATSGIRKGIRKRLMQAGMSSRQVDEAMRETDVRDMNVDVKQTLGQEPARPTFFKKSREEG